MRRRYKLRCYQWRPYCRFEDLLFSALNWQNIHKQVYRDSFLTEMYMVFLFNFCLNKFLPYIIVVLFPFSHWKQGIVEVTAFSSLLASWFVNRQIAVPPVGLSAWRSFVIRCSISKIFTSDLTLIHTSLECTWYLYIIGFYALIISLPYYCNIRFLLSLRAGDCRIGGFFVSGGAMRCHYDDLWCHWWRRGCGLDDLLFSVLD